MEMYRGDTKAYTLSFTNGNGEPQSIVGWKVYFTMKQNPNQSDEKAALKVDVTSHDDAPNGKTSIHLSSTLTDKLVPGTYYYDIQVKRTESNIITIDAGEIKVLADITRRTD